MIASRWRLREPGCEHPGYVASPLRDAASNSRIQLNRPKATPKGSWQRPANPKKPPVRWTLLSPSQLAPAESTKVPSQANRAMRHSSLKQAKKEPREIGFGARKDQVSMCTRLSRSPSGLSTLSLQLDQQETGGYWRDAPHRASTRRRTSSQQSFPKEHETSVASYIRYAVFSSYKQSAIIIMIISERVPSSDARSGAPVTPIAQRSSIRPKRVPVYSTPRSGATRGRRPAP